MKERARVIRLTNTNNIRTEVEIRGTDLCLLVRERNPNGMMANDWRVEEHIDLKGKAMKKPMVAVKMKESGTSLLITMNKEINAPAEFERMVKEKVKDMPDLKYTVIDKVNIVIDCNEKPKAKAVYAMLKTGIEDARIEMN